MKVVYDFYMTRAARVTKVACDKIVPSKLALRVNENTLTKQMYLITFSFPSTTKEMSEIQGRKFHTVWSCNNIFIWCYAHLQYTVIAPCNNTQTLKFKKQPTIIIIMFFTAVNHYYDDNNGHWQKETSVLSFAKPSCFPWWRKIFLSLHLQYSHVLYIHIIKTKWSNLFFLYIGCTNLLQIMIVSK